MNHISTLIDFSSIPRHEERAPIDANETAFVINWLFKMLRGSFSAFKQAWPTDVEFNAAKKIWLRAFVLSGINRIEQIQQGLDRISLMGKPFVCTPGEFILWCKPTPQELGFPTLEDAYNISITMNSQFSTYRHVDNRVDDVIRHAIKGIGSMNYRAMSIDAAKKTFKMYYESTLKQFMEGKLKEITKAIDSKTQPHPSDKQRNDEKREEAMKELAAMGIIIRKT